METITVAKNQEFDIDLKNYATCGYLWEIDLDERFVVLEERTVEPNDKIGGYGMEKFTFKAVDLGDTKIVLKLLRPWEKAPEDQRMEYRIIIV
jgi:predicted secreted protein